MCVRTASPWFVVIPKIIIKDCAGKSYDPRVAACCMGILHGDVTQFDECCGEITYDNRKYICCDKEVFSKEERKDCYAPAPIRGRSSMQIHRI